MSGKRLDLLLLERGLADSRAKAQALIMAGQVRIEGQVALKPATPVDPAARVEVEHGPRFVSRGGEKLDAALTAFGLDVGGLVCADVGASTGGFTDCLLQRGAAKVYAIDVGKGLLAWNLRNDSRVVVMEETNARFLESLPEPVGLITIDASFISLRVLLPVVKKWFGDPPSPRFAVPSAARDRRKRGEPEGGLERELEGSLIALIKPQFEAGKREVARGAGVIRDPVIHRRVLNELIAFAQSEGLGLRGLIRSPILGPKGNTEFLAWLVSGPAAPVEVDRLIDAGLA